MIEMSPMNFTTPVMLLVMEDCIQFKIAILLGLVWLIYLQSPHLVEADHISPFNNIQTSAAAFTWKVGKLN